MLIAGGQDPDVKSEMPALEHEFSYHKTLVDIKIPEKEESTVFNRNFGDIAGEQSFEIKRKDLESLKGGTLSFLKIQSKNRMYELTLNQNRIELCRIFNRGSGNSFKVEIPRHKTFFNLPVDGMEFDGSFSLSREDFKKIEQGQNLVIYDNGIKHSPRSIVFCPDLVIFNSIGFHFLLKELKGLVNTKNQLDLIDKSISFSEEMNNFIEYLNAHNTRGLILLREIKNDFDDPIAKECFSSRSKFLLFLLLQRCRATEAYFSYLEFQAITFHILWREIQKEFTSSGITFVQDDEYFRQLRCLCAPEETPEQFNQERPELQGIFAE